jgi:hypothetical protein
MSCEAKPEIESNQFSTKLGLFEKVRGMMTEENRAQLEPIFREMSKKEPALFDSIFEKMDKEEPVPKVEPGCAAEAVPVEGVEPGGAAEAVGSGKTKNLTPAQLSVAGAFKQRHGKLSNGVHYLKLYPNQVPLFGDPGTLNQLTRLIGSKCAAPGKELSVEIHESYLVVTSADKGKPKHDEPVEGIVLKGAAEVPVPKQRDTLGPRHFAILPALHRFLEEENQPPHLDKNGNLYGTAPYYFPIWENQVGLFKDQSTLTQMGRLIGSKYAAPGKKVTITITEDEDGHYLTLTSGNW